MSKEKNIAPTRQKAYINADGMLVQGAPPPANIPTPKPEPKPEPTETEEDD